MCAETDGDDGYDGMTDQYCKGMNDIGYGGMMDRYRKGINGSIIMEIGLAMRMTSRLGVVALLRWWWDISYSKAREPNIQNWNIQIFKRIFMYDKE